MARRKRGSKIALEKGELLKLLKVAREHSERDFLMILVGYLHGLRVSEICALTSDDVKDGHISVARLKGSLRTVQPLRGHSNTLLNEKAGLSAWMRDKKKGETLFGIGRFMFRLLFIQYCREAGIPSHKAFPHVLKHSCAIHNIRTAGIENVRQYLGHKSIASTGAYLKVTDSEAAAAMQF
jgi:integrase